MSRLGKKPITIPTGVEAVVEKSKVMIKGPKGTLERVFDDIIEIKKEDNSLVLSPRKENKQSMALWGTYASLLMSMIQGVSEGFEKKLQVEGVGFKANMEGKKLVLNLGFSHPVEMETPEGIEISTEKNVIIISGIDKEKVGQTAAKIRDFKKPEPYKGKGIRYEGEVIRRKAGKKAVGSS